MQVYPNRFQQHIGQNLQNFYLVFGDEPQQKLDTIEAIRARGKQQGFVERQSMSVDGQFEWRTVLEASQSLSLFSSTVFIELEIPTGKPGTDGAKVLTELAQSAHPELLVVLHGGKIGKEVQNAKWFKALDQQGVYVPCYPLEGQQLKSWLQQYMNQIGLRCEPDGVNLIADFCEGNLMAARQEIDKLKLLYPTEVVNLQQVESAIVDQSRYNVFQLVDVLLSGDGQKTIKMLLRLESEGLEPTIVLWALVREWQLLSQLKFSQQHNQTINWNSLRIWKNKQSLYLNALSRLSEAQLRNIQDKLHHFDQRLKQSAVFRPYIELAHLCLLFMPYDLQGLPLEP